MPDVAQRTHARVLGKTAAKLGNPWGTAPFRYLVGDSLASVGTNLNVRRTTQAAYYSSSGFLLTASAFTPRDSHFLGGKQYLLIEGQRTNSCLQSEAFDNASWTKDAGVSGVTANAIQAPDGSSNADKILENATATASHNVNQTFSLMTASTAQSISVFAKAAERTWLLVAFTDKSGAVTRSWVNLSTGAVGTKAAGHTIRVTALANNWYRIECVVSSSATGATTPVVSFGPASADNTATYTGTLNSGIYLWGAQVEVDGPFVTSYIATGSGVVTRALDAMDWDFPYAAQDISVYADAIYLGGKEVPILSPGANTPGWWAGITADGHIGGLSEIGGDTVDRPTTILPNIGDRIEVLFDIDNSSHLATPRGALNGGSEVIGASAATNGFGNFSGGIRIGANSGDFCYAVSKAVALFEPAATIAEMRSV